jgi:uncharacterized membrane protein (TIGR02234 family)
VTERRELTVAVLGAAAAGGLALMAGGQRWADVTVERAAPLPPVSAVVTGADVAPLVPATGLVLLAAAVALVAVRGAGRVVVGLLMAVAAGVLGWAGLRGSTGGLDAGAVHEAAGRPADSIVELSVGWPLLAVVAGVVGLAAGLLVVLRGRRWPGMGRRYERSADTGATAARPRTDEERAQAAWQALDRGEDPTVDAVADRPSGPGVTG